MKKIIFFVLASITIVIAQDKSDYSPQMYGYVRAWYQNNSQDNSQEFNIKMARFGVKGKVNEYADYKVFVDFARFGSFNTVSDTINNRSFLKSASAKFSDVLLDAVATIKPVKNLAFSLGQFKVPFSTDNLKSAAVIDFVNRPFITSVAPGLRDIGVMGTFTGKSDIPVSLMAGVFNGAGQNNSENDKTLNYSLRGVVEPVSNFELSANYYGGRISGTDVHIYDLGLGYKISALDFSAEYAHRASDVNTSTVNSYAYFASLVYYIKTDNAVVSGITPAVRYDYYDSNSSLSNNEVNRTSVGFSLEFAKINYAHLRFNYEFYKTTGTNYNNLVIEMQTRF